MSAVPTLASQSKEGLTEGGHKRYCAVVEEYAKSLLNQAKSIEESERSGVGQAEITAAHFEEAKWALLRRRRRRSRRPALLVLSRGTQVAASIMFGVGGSNFKELWGAIMCVFAVILASTSFVFEREIDREDE